MSRCSATLFFLVICSYKYFASLPLFVYLTDRLFKTSNPVTAGVER